MEKNVLNAFLEYLVQPFEARLACATILQFWTSSVK